VRAAGKTPLLYGELTRGEKLVKTLPADGGGGAGAVLALTSPAQWKVAGLRTPKVDGRDFVTGAPQYTSDLKRPGMLFGKTLRPAAFEATLVSLDAAKAEAMPGVKVVRDGDFVGLVAPDAFAAESALVALAAGAKWKEKENQPSNATIFEFFRKNAEAPEEGRGGGTAKGSVEDGLASSDVKLAQSYTVEYIAHAPLEPRAAVAEWDKARSSGKLTVWTGSQRPFAVRDELAAAFRVPAESVRVVVPDTGSAYGGKHTGDAAVEARLAKAAGKPVKVVWTREEEFTGRTCAPAASST
jgi:isoquinoline 1-oxidoreductase